MPAYNANFLTLVPTASPVSNVTGAKVTSNVADITTKELLVAVGEIVMAGTPPDIVEQITSSVPLLIQVDLLTTTPDNTTVPLVPGTVSDSSGSSVPTSSTAPADTSSKGGTRVIETYLDTFMGNYVVAHKVSRAWANLNDPAALHIVYESTDKGASFTQRPYFTAPISKYQTLTAGRASDKVYLSIYLEKAAQTESPTIYVTKGVIGDQLGSTPYKWERPDLPICIACDGAKFVVITEGNKVYTSLDGASWTKQGTISPPMPFSLISLISNGYISANTGGLSLKWLPGLAKWIMTWPGLMTVYTTSDANALSGWNIGIGPATTTGSVTTVYRIHNGHPPVEVAGNLYMAGLKLVTENNNTQHASIILKSTDGGANWTVVKTMGYMGISESNGPNAIIERVDLFGGKLVAYTKGFNPQRLSTVDGGTTWVTEDTNLPYLRDVMRLVLSDGVAAIVNIGVGNDEFWYAADGLNFVKSSISVTQPSGTVDTPAAQTDIYWSMVKAMSWNQYPVGQLPYPVPVKDVAGSKVTWSGYTADSNSTQELPYLGGATVKARTLQYATWREVPAQFITTPGSTDSRYLTGQLNYPVGVMSGNFTFEQILATDSEFDQLVMYFCNADLTADGIKLHLGRNLGFDSGGLINPLISIHKNGAVAPYFETLPVFDLPSPLTYFHIAVEREGNVVTVYLNGVAKGSVTQAVVYPMLQGCRVAAKYYGQYRLTVGTARYKGNFTPPAALFPTS